MKALIKGTEVIQVQEQQFEVHPDFIWVSCPDDCTTDWSYIGGVLTPPVTVVPSIPEVLKLYQDAIQVALDNKAREKMYENALSIATYISSTNPHWQSEAETFLAWRDAVYVYALNILDEVQSGGEQPTIEEVVSGMPTIVWPS